MQSQFDNQTNISNTNARTCDPRSCLFCRHLVRYCNAAVAHNQGSFPMLSRARSREKSQHLRPVLPFSEPDEQLRPACRRVVQTHNENPRAQKLRDLHLDLYRGQRSLYFPPYESLIGRLKTRERLSLVCPQPCSKTETGNFGFLFCLNGFGS